MDALSNQLDPLTPEFATQADADSYDVWFRAKVQEALDSKKPRVAHDKVMSEMRAMLEAARKSRAINQQSAAANN